MIILTIRTDKPESEIGLFDDNNQLAYETWQAHRQLAETIHDKIDQLLQTAGKELGDIQAVAAYKGPGSFTGLRIGMSVANALAYSLEVAVASETGEQWKQQAIKRLQAGQNEIAALPEYGAAAHITRPKK